jgi:hypothetical protein
MEEELLFAVMYVVLLGVLVVVLLFVVARSQCTAGVEE